ncbi:DNA-directed RNA polymerase subunit delta [Brevibacillus thermoruber]|uniref:DNA-directed RNA polymerase subunit delta n=1 Tax=Brevibacillus thermoruber TaxID=33942 RepID=UPI0005D0F99F
MSQLLAHMDREKMSEMALVDIAYEILRETNRPYNFRELMDELAALRGMTEEQKMAIIAQVYTEINIDGRFVCLGDNTWGLKRWYPTDAVEETQEGGKKKKVLLDDDFDDYEIEEDIVEEFEEDEIAIFEDDEEFLDDAALDDDLDPELDDEEEIVEDEDLFEDEDVDNEDAIVEVDEDTEDF